MKTSFILVSLLLLGLFQAELASQEDLESGAATMEEAAVGFLRAVTAGDLDAAQSFLMDESVCLAAAPAAEQAPCLAAVSQMRQVLLEEFDTFPQLSEPGQVTILEGQAPPGIHEVMVHPAEGTIGEPVPLMLVEGEGRFYIGFAIRAEPE